MRQPNLRTRFTVLLGVTLLTVSSGCVEGEVVFTINPDGSGKAVFDMVMPPQIGFSAGGGNTTTLEGMLKGAVGDILGGKGISAWEDVSVVFRPDGKIRFRGTAYFQDVGKFESKSVPMPPPGLAKRNGKLVVTIRNKKKDATKPKKKRPDPRTLNEKELSRFLLLQRAKYQQGKGIMQAMLLGMKIKTTYRLPGKVTSIRGFQRDGDRAVSFELNGKKVMESIEKLMSQTDEQLKAQLRKKGNFLPFDDTGTERELPGFFQELRTAEAVVANPTGPQFNYTNAVAAARKKYPALKKSLKIAGDPNIRLPGDPNTAPKPQR